MNISELSLKQECLRLFLCSNRNMFKVNENTYGRIGVDREVLKNLIIEKMKSMDSKIVPCNRKGKIGKKTPFIGKDAMSSSVEIKGNEKSGITIRLYFLLNSELSTNIVSDEIFDNIEDDFDMLGLRKPRIMVANIKGLISNNTVVERNIEVVRHNG